MTAPEEGEVVFYSNQDRLEFRLIIICIAIITVTPIKIIATLAAKILTSLFISYYSYRIDQMTNVIRFLFSNE